MRGAMPDFGGGLFRRSQVSGGEVYADKADEAFLGPSRLGSAPQKVQMDAAIPGATADTADDAFLSARGGAAGMAERAKASQATLEK
jgi:hypothetical protein